MADDVRPDLEPPWGEHRLPEEGRLDLEIGPLSLWVQFRSGEIWLAHEGANWTRRAEPVEHEPPSEGEGWTRWPVPRDTSGVHLSPLFPPRTLVVKPELSFRLPPRSSARIYVRVPLWAGVETVGQQQVALTELPSVLLSDTWWGQYHDGELCYWLPTSARRSVPRESISPHHAVCPLELHNRSEEELEVEKVALRVAHLSLFRDEAGLWSDVTRVQYRGEAEGSEVDVSGRPPEESGSTTRVSGPRTPSAKGFRARTFGRLWSLSGLGGL